MELLPLGPVVIVDTPGMDDEGDLGELRVRKARQELNRVDAAVLVADAGEGLGPSEKVLLELFREKEIPYLIAFNKADLLDREQQEALGRTAEQEGKFLLVSARDNWRDPGTERGDRESCGTEGAGEAFSGRSYKAFRFCGAGDSPLTRQPPRAG